MKSVETMFTTHCRLLLSGILIQLLVACSEQPAVSPASLVVTGARVWTGDASQPWAEAVASRGEHIVAVGSSDDMAAFIGEKTKVMRANGAMLVPGFIDTHVHFTDSGAALASVQLRDAATPEEFARRIGEYAGGLEAGEWVLHGTWDHENWGGELPTRQWLDALTPDNPVWVTRLDGHMSVANSLALELAGVDENTADVQGGTIVRDASGAPTGLLKDNAMGLVLRVVPKPGQAQMDRTVDAATNYLAANGVTTVHDMSYTGEIDLSAYRRARDRGSLKTRIYALRPLTQWEGLAREVAEDGAGDDWVRVGGLKGFMDGSLGSHTAAFLEPFTDTPEDAGFMLQPPREIQELVQQADAAGLHVVVHAIGDRAIRSLLDIYQRVVSDNGPRDRRFRIEHAQHIHPDDIGRFARQEVIASMQPYHAIDDGRWAEKVIGPERIKTTYAFASLLDSGARVAFGSDWSVAPATPLEGIFAAVSRQTLDGANPGGWVPEQKITVEQALRAYTVEAAFAGYDEQRKGSLSVGKLADMVLIDRDLTAVSVESLAQAQVLATIVNGELVFNAR